MDYCEDILLMFLEVIQNNPLLCDLYTKVSQWYCSLFIYLFIY